MRAFDELSEQDLLKLTDMDNDAVRAEIDTRIMDAIGSESNLRTIPHLISKEPMICGNVL